MKDDIRDHSMTMKHSKFQAVWSMMAGFSMSMNQRETGHDLAIAQFDGTERMGSTFSCHCRKPKQVLISPEVTTLLNLITLEVLEILFKAYPSIYICHHLCPLAKSQVYMIGNVSQLDDQHCNNIWMFILRILSHDLVFRDLAHKCPTRVIYDLCILATHFVFPHSLLSRIAELSCVEPDVSNLKRCLHYSKGQNSDGHVHVMIKLEFKSYGRLKLSYSHPAQHYYSPMHHDKFGINNLRKV